MSRPAGADATPREDRRLVGLANGVESYRSRECAPAPRPRRAGSPEQRKRWFATGFRSGDPAACDTFRGRV